MSAPSGHGALGVVIVAAGSGTRFRDAAKVFHPLGGKPVLAHSLALFNSMPDVAEIALVLGRHTLDQGAVLVETLETERVRVCVGGATRADSVRAGLALLSDTISLVAVHDAARPLVAAPLVERVLDAARSVGAAIPAVPVRDTIHGVDRDGRIASVLDRDAMRAAQTPQIARRDWLERAITAGDAATDEGGMLHAAGYPVAIVEGDPENLKLTWPEDLAIAEAILAARGSAR